MAQTKNLGKVTVTPQGTYNASTDYVKLDVVNYGGSSWMALQDVTGVTPTAGQYWMQIASKGDEGDPGDPGDTITVDGVAAVDGNIPLNALRYSAMTLNSSQKAQARSNIDAQEVLTIDTAMSGSSTNPVQNKVIKAYIDTSFATATDGKAPAIYDDATPADIVTVTDAAENMNIKDLVVNITAVQTGTGDPSPSNIRPISGWTKSVVTRTGKNLCDPSLFSAENVTVSDGVYTFSRSGYTADLYSGQNGTDHVIPSTVILPILPAGTYTWSIKYIDGGVLNGVWAVDENGNRSSLSTTAVTDGDYRKTTFTLTKTSRITICRGSNTNPSVFSEPQIEFGTERTSYSPYTGTTLTTSWQTEAGTVYGGTIDPITGVLTVTAGYIASYNGETLPSTWISDRDVYAEGTTPTTGAEVVYTLASPTTYNLTPATLSSVLGTMNVWADCGSIASMNYPCDTKLYVDAKTAALLALLSEE